MTSSSFAVLALGSAMVVMLVVELRIPFRPLRAWLSRADHVAVDVLAGGTADNGPWGLRSGSTGQWLSDERFTRLSEATRRLPLGHRLRAYYAEWAECPWCSGGYVTLAALAVFAFDRGGDVLVFWPALWFTASSLVVVVRRVAEP